MSRVGKRAFSNIEDSSQGVQFWTGSTGIGKRWTLASSLGAMGPCHAGHYPPKEPRALPQSVEEDLTPGRAPAAPDAAGRGTDEGAAPAKGGDRRLGAPSSAGSAELLIAPNRWFRGTDYMEWRQHRREYRCPPIDLPEIDP